MSTNPRIVQALVVRSAIMLYLKTGLKANTAYTPANMRITAANITGQTFPRSRKGLEKAHEALTLWLRDKGGDA